jgi:hypothetical protein
MSPKVYRYIVENLSRGGMTKPEIAARTVVPLAKVREIAAKLFARKQAK